MSSADTNRKLANLIRFVAGAIFLGVSWEIYNRSSMGNFSELWRLMLAAFVACIGAYLVAGPISGFLTSPFRMIYLSSWSGKMDRPPYTLVIAKRKAGEIHTAVQMLEEIIRKHPLELQAYLDLMDIAVRDLHNGQMADEVLEKGLHNIAMEQARLTLQEYHKTLFQQPKETPVDIT